MRLLAPDGTEVEMMTQQPIDFAPKPQEGADSPCMGYSCARPGCENVVGAQRRGGRRKVYCCPSCQSQHYEETHPRIQAAPKAKGPTRAQLILARLEQGPATGLELLQAGGGTRYGARLLELRRMGHQITTDMSGEWPVYRLGE